MKKRYKIDYNIFNLYFMISLYIYAKYSVYLVICFYNRSYF